MRKGVLNELFPMNWPKMLDAVAYVFIISLVILGFYAVLSVNGCAAQYPQAEASTPQEIYLKARMTFNGLLADYIDNKRAATPAKRAEWSEKIDPWFERGAAALAVWGAALSAGKTAYDAQQDYLEIKNQILQLLLRELS